MFNWSPRVALLNELVQQEFPVRYHPGWPSDPDDEEGWRQYQYYIFSRREDRVIAVISGSWIDPSVKTYGDEDPLFLTIARRYAEVRRGGRVPPKITDASALKSLVVAEAWRDVIGPAILVAIFVALIVAARILAGGWPSRD